MKQNLFNKLWLRVGMIVAIMTTALSGTAWAQTYTLATSLSVGDEVVLVDTDVAKELSGISTTSTPYGTVADVENSTPTGKLPLTVVAGSASGTFAFKTSENKYLSWSSGNSLTTETSVTKNSSWNVSFSSSDEATITNVNTSTRKLQYNSSNPRFACYTSTQKAVKLFKKETGGTPTVAKPTISGTENFLTSTEVSISCATEGAAIQYSTNNGNTWATYTTPFTLTETTTVQAKATKNGMTESGVASMTFTKVTPMTISAARAQETGTVATTGVVTSINGKTAYIQDANAAIVVYGSSNLTCAVGDEILVVGTLSTFNGLLEITEPTVTVQSSSNTVTPEVMTIAEVLASTNQGWLVKIEGATVSSISGQDVTIEQGGSSVLVRFNKTSDITFEADDEVTLTGNIGCYNGVQIANPTDIVVAENTDPVLSVTPAVANVGFEATSGTLDVEATNFDLSEAEFDEFQFFVYDGNEYTEGSQPAWLTVSYDGDNAKISYTVEANEGEARSAYFKLVLTYDEEAIWSDMITINQAAYVAPEAPNVTWDLSTDETATATTTEMTWTSTYATMAVAKGSASTNTNNYYPGTSGQNYTSTRFYKNSELTITPTSGYAITSVVFTATTSSYASALATSTWTNATASTDGTTVTVTPTNGGNAISATIGGTCGFTEVKVYYEEYVAPAAAPVWSTLPTPTIGIGAEYELDLSTYVTGTPTPTISLTTSVSSTLYEFEDGLLLFQPTATGTYEFTFTAENSEGSANATLTVTAVEATTYTLASSITSGKHYIITNGSDVAMGYDKGNNRQAESVSISNGTATVTNDAGVYEFVIYGPDAEGFYTIYDANHKDSEDNVVGGYLYAASSGNNYLKTQEENDDNGRWAITFSNGVASIVAQGENTRNVMQYNSSSSIFACYGSASQAPVYIYEKDGEATPTESVTVTSAGYATYYSENTLDFTGTGITAYVGTLEGTSLTFTPITKAPAYTGLLLVANGGTSKNVPVATTVEAVTNNCLEGTLTGKTLTADDYILNVNSSGKAGFYKAGTHTSLGAHKAYIPAVVGGTVKSFAIDLDDDATAIGTVESFTEEGAIFNLAGQRLQKMQKGINIVNGKKILK